MAGVDHQPLKICVIHQGFQDFSQIPLSRHRQNRRWTFFQFPYVSGKSRQGAPVRKIQNTPLINCRVSRALPPRVPFSPMVYGLIFSHALSLISCRCCSFPIFLPSFCFEDYYITLLLTTPLRESPANGGAKAIAARGRRWRKHRILMSKRHLQGKFP